MTPSARPRVWRICLQLALGVALALGGTVPSAHAATLPSAPTSISTVSVSWSAVALTWPKVTGASSYRIVYSSSSKFTSKKTKTVSTNYGELTSLGAGRYYYFKVAAISDSVVGKYSAAKKVKVLSKKTKLSYLSPTGLSATATTARLDVRWNARGKTVYYRLTWASNSSFTSAKTLKVRGTSHSITGLKANTEYYVKVKAIRYAGADLSQYSRVKTLRTLAYSASAPTQHAARTSATTISASWDAVPGVDGKSKTYQLRYSLSSSMTKPVYLSSATNSVVLRGLAAQTKYYYQVRVIDAEGNGLSPFSAATSATTGAGTASTLRVASYNVASYYQTTSDGNEGTWEQRRDSVVSSIKAQHPDVLGLQEASAGTISKGLSQFEDLIARLDSPYALTNSTPYNCENDDSPYDCVYQYRGASGDVRIAYNTEKVLLLSAGSKKLTELHAADIDRWVSWAIFTQKASGRKFFFADVHLEPARDATGKSTWDDLRIKQAKQVLAEVQKQNPDGLPAYVVGDFNSHKWNANGNGPYNVMTGGGFIDPLGNVDHSWAASGAIVEKRIHTEYSSFNGWASAAPRAPSGGVNGTYLDYIFMSKGITVPEWETVVKVDSDGDFVGRIPSDHNMIRADTRLP